MTTSVEQEQISKACQLLRNGDLVAFPTETVYGLGADASNTASLRKLYAAKGRPTDHPVIVHLHSVDQIADWAKHVPECLELLAKNFWPGPLTVVLPKADHVSLLVTGGQDTVALRIPSHPVALQLLKAFGGGLAAPSANKFGRISPTRAEDVTQEFGDEVAMVLDGGACQVGIESTILDLSGDQLRILRPGMIEAADLQAVSGLEIVTMPANSGGSEAVRVPGALPSHYAPVTKVKLISSRDLETHVGKYLDRGTKLAVLTLSRAQNRRFASSHLMLARIEAPLDPERYAHDLYHSLRELDKVGADLIVVEEIPEEPHWSGIRDRLRRAAAN